MTDKTLTMVLDYMTNQLWAMEPNVLSQFVSVVERHLEGKKLPQEDISKITAARDSGGTNDRKYEITETGRAIIPVSGVIAKYSRMVNGSSKPRGTSIETLRGQLRAAIDDRHVESIFLQIESPGGSLSGLADFAQEVYEASFVKPVVAFADDLAASAAYWIGSQANVLYASQTADVGSIGIYSIFVDSSARAAQEGLRFIIVRTGQNKGVGSAGVEITDENVAAWQELIDQNFEVFLKAILRGRKSLGLAEENLRELADGRLYSGIDAVRKKLADGIMTYDAALAAKLPAVRKRTGVYAAVASAAENSLNNKENFKMADEQTKKDAAENIESAKEAATSAERTRITAISSALEGTEFADVRNKAIAEGMTLTEAKAAAFDVSQKLRADDKSKMQAEIDTRQERLDAIANAGEDKVTASTPPDANEETKSTKAGDTGKAETFNAAVEEFQKKGMTKGAAISRAAKKYPESHAAWIESKQK